MQEHRPRSTILEAMSATLRPGQTDSGSDPGDWTSKQTGEYWAPWRLDKGYERAGNGRLANDALSAMSAAANGRDCDPPRTSATFRQAPPPNFVPFQWQWLFFNVRRARYYCGLSSWFSARKPLPCNSETTARALVGHHRNR